MLTKKALHLVGRVKFRRELFQSHIKPHLPRKKTMLEAGTNDGKKNTQFTLDEPVRGYNVMLVHKFA